MQGLFKVNKNNLMWIATKMTDQDKLDTVIRYLCGLEQATNGELPIKKAAFVKDDSAILSDISMELKKEGYDRAKVRIALENLDKVLNGFADTKHPRLTVEHLKNFEDLKNIKKGILVDELEKYHKRLSTVDEGGKPSSNSGEEMEMKTTPVVDTHKNENTKADEVDETLIHEEKDFIKKMSQKEGVLLKMIEEFEKSILASSMEPREIRKRIVSLEAEYDIKKCKRGIDDQFSMLIPKNMNIDLKAFCDKTGFTKQKIGLLSLYKFLREFGGIT